MGSPRRAHLLHEAFELSLGVKAATAAAELIAGLALWAVPHGAFASAAGWMSGHELSVPTADRIAAALMRAAEGFSIQSQQFFALYLASHGLVKLAVVAALWRGYLWAYPLALAVMALFILYQLYRLSLEMSWPLVGLTLFDLIVVALIWTEYRAREATIAKGA